MLTAKQAMTAVQWQEHKREMAGMQVSNWNGTVKSVDERGLFALGYTMRVDADGGCGISFTISEKQTALLYSVGQRVAVTGQIDSYAESSTFVVNLKDNPAISGAQELAQATASPLPSQTTPTSAPSATPMPGKVQTATLNVREGPGTNYGVVATLNKDDDVWVVGQNSDGSWYQIRLTDARVGWVSSSLVALTGSGTPPVVIGTPQTTPTAPPGTTQSLPTGIIAPQCSALLATRQRMTDAQWYDYRVNLKGQWVVDWPGRIREVTGRGPYGVWVDVTSECDLYFALADQAAALALSLGQQVKITGQIDYSTDFLGLTIYLEDYSVTIK